MNVTRKKLDGWIRYASMEMESMEEVKQNSPGGQDKANWQTEERNRRCRTKREARRERQK
jgi:hypothetical protein